jgi:hypothetical protein
MQTSQVIVRLMIEELLDHVVHPQFLVQVETVQISKL